ncbi:MAG: hypothetical protein N2689_15585, partial [Verrucomicrobiae bacterium]|nr:hypothetical protein [Verrucomicrobiae bacterium]
LHLGAEAHVLDGLRPDRQARSMADRAIDVLYTTPAQLKGLVAAGIDWPRLRHVIVGGAKLAEADRRALSARTDAKVTEFYGAAQKSGNAGQALAEVQRDWLVKLRRERGLHAAVRLAGPFILSSQGQVK